MKFNLNGLWRGIRKALGVITAAWATLEETWGKLPPSYRKALVDYASLAGGFGPFATEQDFWRWCRGQKDDQVRILANRALELLTQAEAHAAQLRVKLQELL